MKATQLKSGKWIATTLAAALLLGAVPAVVATPAAYASSKSDDDEVIVPFAYRISSDLSKIVWYASVFMDKEFGDVQDALQGGSTLGSIANGIKDDDYRGREELREDLEGLYRASVKAALANKEITAEEAAKYEGKIKDRVAQALDTAGYKEAGVDTDIPLKDRFSLELNQIVKYAAIYLEMDYADVISDLKSGLSLSDLSHRELENSSELHQGLKNMYETSVNSALEAGRITKEEADGFKADIAKRLSDALSKPGYVDAAVDTSIPLEQRYQAGLSDIVKMTAIYLDLEEYELKDELNASQSINQVADRQDEDDDIENRYELFDAMKNYYNYRVDTAVAAGQLTSEEAADIRSTNEKQLSDALNQPGYEDKAVLENPSMKLEERFSLSLDDIVLNASIYMDMELQDLIDDLKSGDSLLAVADRERDDDFEGRSELIERLEFLYQSRIDRAVENRQITSAEAAELSKGLRARIMDKVGQTNAAL
ncbi:MULTISPECIES: hypothetical protein [Paenibacillus]|uniref:hypothetical protein n=1 Tax=Paenibacillus TaxID=44249 RepID=UPI0022B8AFAC|nr:hypothetical protein [Paenibacillus caseinilyticus]MCZ8520944.1 hypothetical protein [Paenibacillus caseinilyticus]